MKSKDEILAMWTALSAMLEDELKVDTGGMEMDDYFNHIATVSGIIGRIEVLKWVFGSS